MSISNSISISKTPIQLGVSYYRLILILILILLLLLLRRPKPEIQRFPILSIQSEDG